MRLFEIIMAAAAAISIVNLIFIRSNRAGLLLPAVAAAAAAAGIITEGYRLIMLPAYLLSVILLVQGIVRSIRCKSIASYRAGTGASGSGADAGAGAGTSGSRLLKITGFTLLVLVYIVSLALAILFPVVDLPKPSGSYPVGTTLMVFTDTSRTGEPTGSAAVEHTGPGSVGAGPAGAEPAGAGPAGYRNIPVKLWYPASDTSGKQRATWIDSTEISSLFAKCKNTPDILGQLALINTNSYVNAELSEKEKKYPVILFSGGGAMFNGQNVIQMEELASHGYIVCAVGHPNDDFACEYPDGTIIPYDPGHLKALGEDIRNTLETANKQYGEDGSNPEFIRYVLHSCTLNNTDAVKWSQDMSFVADELTKLNSGGKPSNVEQGIINTMDMFAGRFDMEQLGIFGHSFGGAAAGEACLRDSRFKAFINMDGTPFGTALDSMVSQPFMILTTDKDEKKIIRKGYSEKQRNFITVYINGAEHMNFSDFNTIIPNIGKLTGLLGKIDGDRQRVIMNDYIIAFFNKHLKGMQAPILGSSTEVYHEVLLEIN